MSQSTNLEDVLTTTANLIATELQTVDPDLRDEIDTWSELHGLDRLDNPNKIVARQAALNTLLKATLYERFYQQGRLPDFPTDPQEAFNQAAAQTDDSAFDEYVLDRVVRVVDAGDLSDLIDGRHQLIAAEDPAEEIGRLFESLTPQESRRKLGQFRTPPTIAGLMAEWLINDGTETVLDPGMGAGALAAATYQTKQEHTEKPPLSDIHGVDLNELALVMAATALALLNHGEPHNLQIGDFLDLDISETGSEVDAIISNPPYSRHHELDADYKERVNAQAESEVDGTVSALSPMYAYFYYHAAEFLTPGGRLSFITPSEFLETSYGESLKRFVTTEFEIQALVLFDRDEASKFDEALTTSLVSFLEKPIGDDREELTRIVRVDGDPDKSELLAAINGDEEGETEWGFVNVVPQDDLEPTEKWTGLFDPLDIETSDLTPLSELATVTRGIATGQNDYFCLTQDAVEEWGIDEQYLSKIIRNARSVPGYDYTVGDWESDREDGREVWVLYHLTELDEETMSRLQPSETDGNSTLAAYGVSTQSSDTADEVVDYLSHGLSDDVAAHSGYLARHRTPWYVVDRRDPPPVVVTYMSRGGSRFIRNETDARTLSNLHGLYFDVELSDTEQKALLAYLNSEFASEVVRRSGRTYASGMDKIEPNELEGVPVLDPRGLDSETVERLAAQFDALRAAARQQQPTEPVIDRIGAILETAR